ncbi:hypothetical protein PHYPSEUDO_005632 [Phytophthora pseudosyringae]|uniref:Uncharacterized protein n=1 Tax=Phytophthora pseudosyringae TaxID=221518 RepID=A0A8T1VKJ3_9STRA|nr:hypothetical protein PHYPSEUDO_005632 [Phytophthora pseudosyringae]
MQGAGFDTVSSLQLGPYKYQDKCAYNRQPSVPVSHVRTCAINRGAGGFLARLAAAASLQGTEPKMPSAQARQEQMRTRLVRAHVKQLLLVLPVPGRDAYPRRTIDVNQSAIYRVGCGGGDVTTCTSWFGVHRKATPARPLIPQFTRLSTPAMENNSPLANTQWTACGRKLLKDGQNFFVRGVNYSPTPIGKPGRLDMLGEPTIFLRDLQNLRLMNANAVKTYDFYSYVDHQGYLDAAYNDNVDPVYTIFSIWIDQTVMLPELPESGPQFQHLVREYYLMAKQTGAHPAVMGYSIGGEMNSITVIQDEAFWSKFQALTSAVRRGLKENNNAQKIITTTFVDDGGETFIAGEKHNADVDMWGSNIYQTDYPGAVIPRFLAVPGGKPLLVSEYGFPYASDKGIGDIMQLNYVADLLTQQTFAMQNNFQNTDGVDEQAIVGGFLFEYSDEWWKAGNPDEHNLGLVKNGQFPLGYLSEEYFGLYSASRATSDDPEVDAPTLPNVLKARPTVSLLTTIWGNGSLATEGDLITDCSNDVEPVTIASTSNNVVPTAQSTSSLGDFMLLGLFGGVLFFLLGAIRTHARRRKYHKLSPPSSTRTVWGSPRYQAGSATESSLLTHDIDHQVV